MTEPSLTFSHLQLTFNSPSLLGVQQREEKMIELSNGCICCTLREDLLTSLSSLAAERRFDHVLVESSGISEPLPVAESAPNEIESLPHILYVCCCSR